MTGIQTDCRRSAVEFAFYSRPRLYIGYRDVTEVYSHDMISMLCGTHDIYRVKLEICIKSYFRLSSVTVTVFPVYVYVL